jgi:hypothetical protein
MRIIYVDVLTNSKGEIILRNQLENIKQQLLGDAFSKKV